MRPPAALLLLAALFGAGPAAANRFADNPDRAVDRAAHPEFAPIGEVEAMQSSRDRRGERTAWFGTAFLISPCYALTNNHVVFGDDGPQPGRDHRMWFRVGVAPGRPFATQTVATPVVWGRLTRDGRGDWALLKLDRCLGRDRRFGWLEPVSETLPMPEGRRVALVSFPGGRTRGAMRIGRGEVRDFDDDSGTVHYTASAAPGSSGGPVLLEQGGQLRVVGLHQGGEGDADVVDYHSYSRGAANQYIDVRDIIDQPRVKALLDRDRAAFAGPDPAPKSTRLLATP